MHTTAQELCFNIHQGVSRLNITELSLIDSNNILKSGTESHKSGNTASAVVGFNFKVPIDSLQRCVSDIRALLRQRGIDRTGRVQKILFAFSPVSLDQTLLLEHSLDLLAVNLNLLAVWSLLLSLLNPTFEHSFHIPAILSVHCWHHLEQTDFEWSFQQA